MADEGWIKLYRSIRSNWLWEDGNERYLKWWVDLILEVNHSPKKTLINGKLVEVKKGEKKTSILKLSQRWNVSRNTVKKFLDLLEEDGMISRQSRTTDGTTLKVLHYADYQGFEEKKRQQSDQQTDQQTDQRTDHKQELKELKKDNVEFDFKKFFEYLNEKTGHNYRNTESNRKLVKARLNEKYSKRDLSLVIEFKSKEWKDDPDMDKYLRPKTLFAPSHFDDYLNEAHKAMNKATNESTSDGQRKGLTAEEIKAKEEAQMRALVEKQKEAKHE